MFCSGCGAQVLVDAVMCVRCGRGIEKPRSQRQTLALGWWASIVLTAWLFFAIWFFSRFV